MAAAAGEVRPYQNISLKEAGNLIATVGHKIVVIVRGEMGIGKSSILKRLAKEFPNHIPCYVDMTTKDVGDLLMPKVIEIDGMWVCSFIPNSEFGFQFKKPLIIMWDEFTKANKTIQTQCIRALQEWQLGEHHLPEGSIQFATGNLAEEGVLDSLMPHQQNRVMQVVVRKPGIEWIEDFALDNNVHPTIIQAVNQFPQMLMSYMDFKTPGENPYVYDPRKPMPCFTTPRSLEKASDVLHANDARDPEGRLSHDVKVHAIAGLVGERAAMDIMSVHALYEQLPKWEDIIKKPKEAIIPTDAGAQCLLVYSAIQRVEQDSVTPLVQYLERTPLETQALFATTAINTSKAGVVTGNEKFFKWATTHGWLFSSNS